MKFKWDTQIFHNFVIDDSVMEPVKRIKFEMVQSCCHLSATNPEFQSGIEPQ